MPVRSAAACFICARTLARASLALALVGGCASDDGDRERDAGRDASRPQDAAMRDGAARDVAGEVPATPPEVLAHLGDWPLPNRDYENTRASFDATITSANIDALREAWRLPLPDAALYGAVTSNPLVLGDTVYVQDMVSRVYAVDRDTGAVRWTAGGGAATAGPNGVAVGWGKLFANAGDTGVAAYDLRDGRELWRFEPRLVSSEGIDIQPTVYGGSVFVSTVPASLRGLYLGGSRGVLFALDQRDGSTRWSFDTVDSADLWGDAEGNSGGGAWYPPLVDTERAMTYWGTGNPGPWPSQENARNRPGPNLYTNSVLALSSERGELVWYHQEKPHDLFDWDFQNAPMRVRPGKDSGERELVIGSGKTGTVVALDALTGELVWRAAVGRHQNADLESLPDGEAVVMYPGALGGVLTATAYARGVVYAPVVDLPTTYTGSASPAVALDEGKGALTALSVIDGRTLWSVPLDAPCYGAATVVNDLVLTSDANGLVMALATDSGEEIWRYQAPGGINAPLAVAGDLLLVPVGIGVETSLIALRLDH
jgi:glucose dehydrogenase